MRIRKRILYIALSGFFFVTLLSFLLLRFFSPLFSKEAVSCLTDNIFFAFEKCGHVESSKDGSNHIIAGVVKKKHIIGEERVIELFLENSKKQVFLEKILLPQLNEKMSLGISSESKLNYSIENPKKAFDMLADEQIVLIELPIVSEEILTDLQNKSINRNLTRCTNTNKLFITYLKTSTFVNYLLYKYETFKTNCYPTTTQISLLQ